jgi:surface antigen
VVTGWRRSRRGHLRRALLASVVLIASLLLLAERLLPAADALTVPLRVVDRGTRLSEAGPAPTQYPYRPGSNPLALDANGFVVGQCTSFVAWWLGAHHVPLAVLTVGPSGTGSFLNASGWDTAARTAGFHVGQRPVVGAVAQWHAGERSSSRDSDGRQWVFAAGEPGHVAVVTAVLPDGQAEWVEYGWQGRPQLHEGHGWAPRYLYLGVAPPSVPDQATPS